MCSLFKLFVFRGGAHVSERASLCHNNRTTLQDEKHPLARSEMCAPPRIPLEISLEGPFPFQQSRMRVIESAVGRVRRQITQILFVQLAQRADQRPGFIHHFSRKRIRLEFMATRPPMSQRGKPEGHDAGQQAEQEQSRRDGARRETKSTVKPFLFCQEGNEVKTCERADCRKQQSFLDMLLLEMAYLMRQHRLQFRFGQLLDQGVE